MLQRRKEKTCIIIVLVRNENNEQKISILNLEGVVHSGFHIITADCVQSHHNASQIILVVGLASERRNDRNRIVVWYH